MAELRSVIAVVSNAAERMNMHWGQVQFPGQEATFLFSVSYEKQTIRNGMGR
jgi:hypothetical protein